MGPALHQLQVALQRALNAVEDDIAKNKGTACAKLEDEIRGASLVADALVAPATIGRLSAVAEQIQKREKTMETVKETMKMELADVVKRSAVQKTELETEDRNRRGCS